MAIVFQCEHCEKDIEVPDELGGQMDQCPHCGHSMYTPLAAGAESEALDLTEIDLAEDVPGLAGKAGPVGGDTFFECRHVRFLRVIVWQIVGRRVHTWMPVPGGMDRPGGGGSLQGRLLKLQA